MQRNGSTSKSAQTGSRRLNNDGGEDWLEERPEPALTTWKVESTTGTIRRTDFLFSLSPYGGVWLCTHWEVGKGGKMRGLYTTTDFGTRSMWHILSSNSPAGKKRQHVYITPRYDFASHRRREGRRISRLFRPSSRLELFLCLL